MTLDHAIFRETCPLKLAIDVGCEDVGTALFALDPVEEQVKPWVRFGPTVEVEAMTIEAPSASCISSEPGGVGHVDKGQTGLSERRKSGNPESTPMPAPAPMNSASASAMAWLARLMDAGGMLVMVFTRGGCARNDCSNGDPYQSPRIPPTRGAAVDSLAGQSWLVFDCVANLV